MVASASQLPEDSTDAPEVDVTRIYLQTVGVEQKKRRVYGLGSQASTFYPDSISSSSAASTHYNTLFDERLRDELQGIEENFKKKNEEMQQKNEEMQKQIEDMKKREEERHKREEERQKREEEMQQKIYQMEQIVLRFTQGTTSHPPAHTSGSPELTTHDDSEHTCDDF